MARFEGVERVLEFLSRNPSVIGNVYRHTDMKTVPYIVTKLDSYYLRNQNLQNNTNGCSRPVLIKRSSGKTRSRLMLIYKLQ